MLKIRKEQMDVMSNYMLRHFEKRMFKHLRQDFPKELQEHNIKEQDLEPLVKRGITEAEKYGLVNEGDVQLYLECTAILGPEFDRDKKLPWAGKILSRNDIDGPEKMAQISEYLIFGLG